MKCPGCSGMENKVIDSRLNKEGTIIRRRRECLSCTDRFTTYEKLERSLPLLIKKDGRREEFDRDKVIQGLQKACQKRPVSIKDIEDLVDRVEQYLQELGEKEVSAVKVGEKVISEIYNLDDVAYVRFASVYRSFKDVNEFMVELKEVLKSKEGSKSPGDHLQ
ncbi:MAG: transcriptional repressor NrdR [Nitrospina sp.]|jgi:transcriptional repressor NrdR|nr:transcriptional repressor NrdR [Nitrospina sp.]MBT4046929.1 transcriptional repressor NrdR [Nitrospina sp.]MBT4557351.1 transcriptional repressor NrdR [Nitrospina sp.]MBT5652616.1 transcriptional repressor NrdR [Nitrospina sp.]MBT6739543.1 transcriptional repressor NrdR [Nitrospina sp.]